jgi:osmotically-inducible protein OsmY
MITSRRIWLLALAAAPALLADEKQDDDIYDKVRLRLAGDPDVKGGALEVLVKNGEVTLKGIVRSDKAKAKAEKLTGKIKGVTKVINELRVSPTGNL